MTHAEIGDFQKAMALQNRAIRMAVAANRLDLIPGYMDNLTRFQAEKPCRAPWPEQGLPLRPAPTSAKGAFRDYPADSPY